MRPEEPVRVLLVDDHPVFRQGLRWALDPFDDVAVVGEAGDGAALLERLAADDAAGCLPDVVLMDLRMPGLGGLEATAAVAVRHPGVAVLVLTMDADDDSVFAALRAGARGYLLKEADGEEIRGAVLGVASGQAVFGPGIASRVIGFFAGGRRSAAADPFPQLTDREREVLELVAQGLDNAAIARRLFLSPKTVRNRVSDVLGKLQAASRAEAVAKARDAGLA